MEKLTVEDVEMRAEQFFVGGVYYMASCILLAVSMHFLLVTLAR